MTAAPRSCQTRKRKQVVRSPTERMENALGEVAQRLIRNGPPCNLFLGFFRKLSVFSGLLYQDIFI